MAWLETVSAFAVPLTVALVGCLLLFGRHSYFDAFLAGAREGLQTVIGLFPALVALIVAVSMLHASGAVGWLCGLLSPLSEAIGVPSSLLPLLLTRPFSGSASSAAFSALLEQEGADSLAGLCASVIFGSSDTMVYVLATYFSSVGIRHTRHAFAVATAVMLLCIFFSCFLCRLWFFS